MDFETVGEGIGFPEGPVVMPDGSVIYVDLVRGVIGRAWKGRIEVIAEPGGGPNGAALGPDGALYVVNNGGIDLARGCYLADGEARVERIDLRTGKVERLYEATEAAPLRGPNDIVFDADGGFWFTDMGKTLPTSLDVSALYYAKPDGSSIERKVNDGLSYNGIGLSPDGKTLYAADTRSARLWRVGLEGPGQVGAALSPRGRPDMLVGTGVGDVWFDSLAVTAAGDVCVGTLYAGGITTFSPSGETRHTPAPDPFTTNIAFGGEDMMTAFLTLSSTGRIAKVRWDQPGLKLNFGQY